jgi:hypothetical protein
VSLDPAEFSADITHPYWPMTPGTQWTYRPRCPTARTAVVPVPRVAVQSVPHGLSITNRHVPSG